MSTDDAGRHLHWESALDRLEMEVMLAERVLTHPEEPPQRAEAWDEPTPIGSIPADLVERALAIRERQVRAEAALAEALGSVRRQHRFAERVDRATGRRTDHPVYVDVDA